MQLVRGYSSQAHVVANQRSQPRPLGCKPPANRTLTVCCVHPNIPWNIAWQVNERDTTWTPLDRGALVKQMAMEKSGWTPDEFEIKYVQLLAVLPGVAAAQPKLSPAVLLGALQDTDSLAKKLIQLKVVMPSTNVGVLVLMHPPLLLLPTEVILQGYQGAQAVLGDAVEEVMQWYPALLEEAVLAHAMSEMRRLVPHLMRNSTPKQWIHLLGAVVRTDAELGPSATWDSSTCSWRD